MATVPTSLLDELTAEVNKLSGDAQQKTGDALAAILADWERNGGGDIAALRETAYEAIDTVLSYYADTCAAARAAEYYDAVRAAQGFPGSYSAVAESLRDPSSTLDAVRYFVGKVAEGKATTFLSLCLARVDEETRRAANRCVAYNATKDPAKPRYGRVPRGETCGFCLMLASFGFYAKTIEAAEHSHAHCDCRIVPGFNGQTTVKGYKPEGMYQRYNSCLSTLGGRSGLRADWEAMPKTERDAYVKARGGSNSKAFEAYSRKRIAAEIETRDPEWYKTGEVPKVVYTKPRADLRDHEKDGVDWLRRFGFSLETIPEDPDAPANLDLLMNGQQWEMKNVTNAGSSVKNQVARAKKKWVKLGNPGEALIVLTLSGCDASIEEVADAAGALGAYREALIVSEAGVLRIKK